MVEDSVGHAPDIVLRVLVGVIGVVDCRCTRLLGRAQVAVSVKSEGASVAKITPLRLATEGVRLTLFNNYSVAVGLVGGNATQERKELHEVRMDVGCCLA